MDKEDRLFDGNGIFNLRNRLARRVSGVKGETELDLPILSQIEETAGVEQRKQENFIKEDIDLAETESLRDLLPFFQNMPDFAWGEAHAKGRGWARVRFKQPMKDPVVVAVGDARGTEMLEEYIEEVGDIREKSIDKIKKVGDIGSKEINRINRPDFNSDKYCRRVADHARDGAKNLSPPWPFNYAWNWMCDTFVYNIFYYGWKGSGWIVNLLWDSFIQDQVDETLNTINDFVGDTNYKVNKQLQEITNIVNDQVIRQINELVSDTNNKVNNQIDEITNKVNKVIPDLYKMFGIPDGVAITPMHVRNINSSGFDFLSLGDTTCYWVAID